MNKQQHKEQKRKAKKLARVLGKGEFSFVNSIFVPQDRIMAVVVEAYWNGKNYMAKGASKCNRVDPWNEEIGLEVATGRALLRIAFQILKDEQLEIKLEHTSPVLEIIETINEEFGNVQGVIFVKKRPEPRVMFEEREPGLTVMTDENGKEEIVTHVPGSAKYRGDNSYGAIKPEVVPTGLEVMKEKGMLDDDLGDTAEGRSE